MTSSLGENAGSRYQRRELNQNISQMVIPENQTATQHQMATLNLIHTCHTILRRHDHALDILMPNQWGHSEAFQSLICHHMDHNEALHEDRGQQRPMAPSEDTHG